MENVKIGICEPSLFSEKALTLLKNTGEVTLFEGGDLKEFLTDKDAIFVRLKYQIDDHLLENAKKLKYICSPTTGLNHISISDDSIMILSLKGEYDFLETIRATPEHIFGLTISLLRNYNRAFLRMDNSLFERDPYRGYELYNNKVGLIGFGRIGRILSKYFNAFDATVYYYDIRNIEAPNAFKCNSLNELIEKSNIIILAAQYTDDNRNMISDNCFSLMKNKYFINAARGELVDEGALLEYVKRDYFKGVAIDVISNETTHSNFLDEMLIYSREKNIIITPHIGGATFTSMRRTEEYIAEKLACAIERL